VEGCRVDWKLVERCKTGLEVKAVVDMVWERELASVMKEGLRT
jgi:hypothetical protein